MKRKTRILSFIIIIFMLFSILQITSLAKTTDEIYQNNLKIYNSQPTDPDVLAFYKLPSRDDSINNDTKEIIDLTNSITKGISSNYNKIKAIHDWVVNNIYYDYDAYQSGNYGDTSDLNTLKTKRSVCDGYINLTVALLRAAGIPAKCIFGSAIPGGDHRWCEAFTDGRWIIIDTTWDSWNRYENGKYTQSENRNKYFDISLRDISADHIYKDYSFTLGSFDLTSFTSIKIPDCITSIGYWEFKNCINLTNITIPDSITSIGEFAFYNCSNLTNITIPDSVASIGDWAFSGCPNLTIYGNEGSYAETYAKNNNIKFQKPQLELPFVGDPLGDVLYSDITAYINGQAIPTSIIAGKTLVVVEDLAKYGFDVTWNNSDRSLRVELNKNKAFAPIAVQKDTTNKPGTFKQKYLYTDIKTYVAGELVESYAINGVTLMNFDDLGKFGTFVWDEKTREIKLTIK